MPSPDKSSTHYYECPVCGRVLPAHSGNSPVVRYCDRASADPQHTGPTEMVAMSREHATSSRTEED